MKILPITALRDTQKILEEALSSDEPIHISKNGADSLVIMSEGVYSTLGHSPISEKPEYDLGQSKPKKEVKAIEYGDHASSPLSDPLGFVRVRSASLRIKIANPKENAESMKRKIMEATGDGVSVLCFHELSLSGYTCGDLFLDSSLLRGCLEALADLTEFSKDKDIAFCLGLPLERNHTLYNCAALICRGSILGIVPKRNIPNYQEFYEGRYFKPYEGDDGYIDINGAQVPFGNHLVFVDSAYPLLRLGIEICEDLWVPDSPSIGLSLAGANLILNPSASNETVGKAEYRSSLVRMTSAKLLSGYVYCDAGEGESTTDCVYSSHQIIAENGAITSQTELFSMQNATSDIDLEKLQAERRKMNSLSQGQEYSKVYFNLPLTRPSSLLRHYPKNPFIPEGEEVDLDRVKEVLSMQVSGLRNRLLAINCHKAIVGLSGGLDSTLALLVAVEAFKSLNYPLTGITALTLPAFGTSKRTHDNAESLAKSLGVAFREISIKETLRSHLKDIGHDEGNHNVTYENAQARERTQVLMDIANDEGSLMVGTGDLSELCLGWCTYNGDHMSMYGVNASIPKTLVRYLCRGYALLHKEAAGPLLDIIDTPISPELLPTKDGEIAQKTEDTVGPYELNDFFIYHYLRFRFTPEKLLYIAEKAYEGVYDRAYIKKWLKAFYRRFYHNQFKRSCLPDGPKVGSVAISPRGDWRMPSDADSRHIEEEIDAL